MTDNKGLLHLKLNIVSYKAFGYVCVCKRSAVRNSDVTQKECRASSRSMIVCAGKSRCLVLFISFSQYLKAVLFRSVAVNEPLLVTAEGTKSKRDRGRSVFTGPGELTWQAVFISHSPAFAEEGRDSFWL